MPQTQTLYIPSILATQWFRQLIFQTMNAVRLSNLSMKYQRLTLSGCKDIGITKIEFVAKTQFQLILIQLIYNP